MRAATGSRIQLADCRVFDLSAAYPAVSMTSPCFCRDLHLSAAYPDVVRTVGSGTLSGAQAASGGDIAADARIIAIAAQGELPAGRFVAQGDIALATEQLAATGGQVVAAGDLSVTSGTTGLVIDGESLQAGQSVSIAAAQSITNAAQILAGDQLRIIAGAGLTNSGDIQAPNLLHITASALRNSGNIDAFGGALVLDGLTGFDNTAGRLSSDTGVLLELTGAHQLAGMIDLTAAGDLTLVAVDFEAAGILRTDVGGQTYLLAAVDIVSDQPDCVLEVGVVQLLFGEVDGPSTCEQGGYGHPCCEHSEVPFCASLG